MNNAPVITIYDSGEATSGVPSSVKFSNISSVPTSAFRVTKFLDDVVGVKVV